ncbi:MAG: 50S ribosomal protein L29 [bacterium]
MKKVDFKNKTQEELNKLLSEKRVALKDFRFNSSGSKVKNVKEGAVIRKEIARILTLLDK